MEHMAADKPNGEASLVRRNGGLNGWHWVVRQGNRLVYYGPYATQALAERFREDVDGYAAYGWARD